MRGGAKVTIEPHKYDVRCMCKVIDSKVSI